MAVQPHHQGRFRDITGKRRHTFGWKPDRPDHRDLQYKARVPKPIPPVASLRGKCGPVEDQGDIGSCTANASTSAMEFVRQKEGRGNEQFSRLFCYFTSRELANTPPGEDSGCQIRDVLRNLATYGCCFEPTWPYTHPEQRYFIRPPEQCFKEASSHKILQYFKCNTIEDIKQSIGGDGFPVVAGFSVPENMMHRDCELTGKVKFPEPNEEFHGGHCVLFLGYDDTMQIGPDVGAFEAQNSWGTRWGNEGHLWLPYKYMERRLMSDPWTIRGEEF